jgi:hypothetical protein
MRQLLGSAAECASSGKSSPSGSLKTDAASKNVTPCLEIACRLPGIPREHDSVYT